MKTEKVQKASYAREVFDKLKAHKLAMLGVGVWILEILIVVFLPMIMNLDPYVSDYAAFDAAPSAAHPLGTDRSEEHTSELQSRLESRMPSSA